MRLTKFGRIFTTTTLCLVGTILMRKVPSSATTIVQICWILFCTASALMLDIRAKMIKTLKTTLICRIVSGVTPILFTLSTAIGMVKGAVGVTCFILGSGIVATIILIAKFVDD